MEKKESFLGITLFELASYAGQKEDINVQQTRTIDVKARIKMAEDFFR